MTLFGTSAALVLAMAFVTTERKMAKWCRKRARLAIARLTGPVMIGVAEASVRAEAVEAIRRRCAICKMCKGVE